MIDTELNSVNTVTSPQQRLSPEPQERNLLKRSLRKLYSRNRSQLLNLCNLIMDNQDILVRQMAAEILRELNNSEDNNVRRFSIVESKPPKIEYDATTFNDIDYNDENIPLQTPEVEVKTPIVSPGNIGGPAERRRFIVDRMWSSPIYPQDGIRTIPKTTILGAMFGLQESTVVSIFVLMRRMAPVISLLYIVFFIIFYLTIFGTIKPEYAWITLICYPMIILQLLLSNLYLVKLLFRSFETWFLLIQAFMVQVVFIYMLQGDVRCICVVYLLFLWLGLIFVDSTLIAPDEKTVGLFIALSSMIVTITTLYIGLWQYESKTLNFGYIYFTAEDFLAQRYLTLMFFILKHIFCAYYHPSCFVILTSRLSTLHMKYKS